MSSSALLLLSEPVDTSGHLHVLQTSPTYLHKDDIPPSELSYLEGLLHEHHTIDVDCSSTLFTCFLKSKPTIEFDGDVYLLTWTVTQSIAYIMLVGNVYLLQWQGIMTSRAVRAFHHILHLVNVTDLPKLAMFQQPLDDAAATIVTRAARPIKLPLNSTFQQFKDMDLSPLGVPPVTYPIRSRFCMVHPYRDMLRAYDNQSLTSRVGHRIHGSGSGSGGRTFISPYSAYLGCIDLSALYSGGLLIGDPMSGKTRLLLEMAKESQQHTIYVFKPFDSFRLSQVCDELQIEFLIVDSAADVPSDDDGDAVTIMFVTMTKLETKQDLVAALNTWTHNQPSRLIVDHFESYKRRSLERIQALNCDRVWGISSLFKVEHWPLAYRVLRFPVDMPSDYYANIAFLYTLCVYVTADHVEPRLLTHTVPRNENEYPYTQVRVAVRETLATTQRAQGSAKIKALVECILKLDSGVVMNQDEVMRSLLYHSNNKRPGGGVYRPLPPLEDLAHGPLIDATNAQPDAEPDALAPCAICLESTPLNPIRNSACSHVLCFACLDAWNVVNSSCPCCRAVYTDTFINLQPTGTKWKKRKAASLMAASYYNVKDNARFRVLRQAILAVKPLLTDGKYVLVITHFSDMLSEYEDIVVAALDKDESCIFQPPRGLDSLRGCKVVVCHSRHISWLRSDPNVLTVLLMDVNMNTSTIETWFRYFAGAIDKKVCVTHYSFDVLLTHEIRETYRQYTPLQLLNMFQ